MTREELADEFARALLREGWRNHDAQRAGGVCAAVMEPSEDADWPFDGETVWTLLPFDQWPACAPNVDLPEVYR